MLEQSSLSIHCSLGILSDLLCSSWDWVGSEKRQWSCLEASLTSPANAHSWLQGLVGARMEGQAFLWEVSHLQCLSPGYDGL